MTERIDILVLPVNQGGVFYNVLRQQSAVDYH